MERSMTIFSDVYDADPVPADWLSGLVYHPGDEPEAPSLGSDDILRREREPLWQAFAYWEPL